MPFVSPVSPLELVNPGIQKSGFIPRDYTANPYGSFFGEFPMQEIPKNEWSPRIKEMVEQKRLPSDLAEQAALLPLHQGGTNSCWQFTVTYANMQMRMMIGQPIVILSPTSVVCKIKNFRDQGGWSTEGIRYGAKHGIVPASLWPINDFSRKWDTPEAWKEAEKYILADWFELKPRTFSQVMTCLLCGIPVSAGYNYMGHAVTLIDPVDLGGNEYTVRYRDNYGTGRGKNGYLVPSSSRANPDDACAPAVPLPSAA